MGDETAPATMRVVVQHRYGSAADVLALEDLPRPVAGDGEVLVRVDAAGVSYPDLVLTSGIPRVIRLFSGLRRPRQGVRGSDVAGTVVACGPGVGAWRVGDRVVGWCADTAGVEGGGFAELARCRGDRISCAPEGLSLTEAAALPTSGVTALQAVRDWAEVGPGDRVLVNGASGGVGSFAVQIAKARGAHVTGVCSARNAELVRSIGADEVVDYTREDFTERAGRYDAILDFPHHAAQPLGRLRRALTPRGVLVAASNTRNRWVGGFARVIPARMMARVVSQRIRAPEMRRNARDLAELAALVASGEVRVLIERTYPLEEAPAAVAHFAEGHTRGKLVIVVGDGG